MIQYRDDAKVTAEEAIDLYIRSTLGERRPIDNKETFEAMLKNANLTITAWDQGKLIGISRSLTDFAYVTYLADLAVDQEYQRMGIGKELIAQTVIHVVFLLSALAIAYCDTLMTKAQQQAHKH